MTRIRTAAGVLAATAATVGLVGVAAPAQAAPATPGLHYTWGNITGTVYFNREETATASFAAGMTAMGALAAEPFGAIIAAKAAQISIVAGTANLAGRCLKIKSNGRVGIYSGSDGDGYCQ